MTGFRTAKTVLYWLQRIGIIVSVTDSEVPMLANSFVAMFSLLCSYFILLPLREDAGISLGTSTLPKLFASSLAVTLLVAPLASAYLSRPGLPREVALRRLYQALAAVLLGFYVVYYLTTAHAQALRHPHLTEAFLKAGSTSSAGAAAAAAPAPPPAFDVHSGDPSLDAGQRLARAAFYIWVNVQNLVAISAMWARCADVFSAEAAARLFGVISAGATLGQLVGSLLAVSLTVGERSSPQGPQLFLLLLSACLLLLAALAASRVQPPGALRGAALEAARASPIPGAQQVPPSQQQAGWRKELHSVLEGFWLIARSGYLLLLCMFLLMTYMVGSLMYFERALVVAQQVHSTSSRTAFFARVNSYSALIITCLQLTLTGTLIKAMGIPASLAAFPLFCGSALVLLACRPTTTAVAAVEVLRKVLGYALVRPAREILFTVVSREEKYKAKVCIDTVVQRLGDALAAGAFQVLDVQLARGVAGVASVGCPLCLLWAGLALYLGRWHTRLAAAAAAGHSSLLQGKSVGPGRAASLAYSSLPTA